MQSKEILYEMEIRDIADPSRFRALKMDEAKLATDIADDSRIRLAVVVGRRPARAEASP